ncbi:MAG TPA: LuxR C-terminal-related transcriptional regulator [Propionibacteriaceae bacterium]|nr:LuxR C-terminal-related transcriptional regulator [Propionibacteriaceae bacterium]
MTSGVNSSPLIRVKRAIPPPRATCVPRTHLERRLESSDAKLAVVVAPAGWGKTSLLSRWASSAAEKTPVAWVSLDENDDEPVRFWTYLLTALSEVDGQIGSAALDALTASNTGPTQLALPLLINELATAPTRYVLVLDDYQVITDHAVHETIEFLISYLPPTAQVVIASRWDPPLPLARMRARGELVEVRANDLRFSEAEAAAMISAVSESDLDPSAASALWQRTEGWPAGLQLAALALRGSPDPLAAAARVRGDDRHLFDYFASEVLPALVPEQRDLLVRGAPLELLSGSLCDAALEVQGSAAMLADLERADMFVVALDADHEWYRCHRLLRDALRHEPEAQDESGTREVLRRAARWFVEHDRLDDAVRHLLRAQDDPAAADLLEAHQSWFFDHGWAASFLGHGERLAEGLVDPQLALALAYAAKLSGHPDRIGHWLDVCDRQLDDHTVITGWRSARAAAVMMRGINGLPEPDTAQAVALCEQAVALEEAAGTPQHPLAMAALGSAYAFDGRFDDAVPILADSWRQRERGHGSLSLHLQLAGLLAISLLQLGRGEAVDRVLAEAAAAASAAEHDWGDAAAPVVAQLRLAGARRSYERGDLDRSRTQHQHAMRLAEIAARPLTLVIGLVYLADLELATGHRSAAQTALLDARELLDNDPTAPFVHELLRESEVRIGRVAVRSAARAGTLLDELTDREMSILRMLPGSATQREIGAALFLSINTVKAYNKSLYRKLGAASRQEAVAAARRLGLI